MMECFKGEDNSFVIDMLTYEEPVKHLEEGGDVVVTVGAGDEVGRSVLDQLEFIEMFTGETSE